MKNKSIENILINAAMFLALLMPSLQVCASEEKKFVPYYCFWGDMGEFVCGDIEKIEISIHEKVDVADTATAKIMLGDEVVAESSKMECKKKWDYYEKETEIKFYFSAPVKIEKGHVYRLVLPAGNFKCHDNPEVGYEEYSKEIEITDYFVGTDSQLFDGCNLSFLYCGGFRFGKMNAELEKVGNPKISIYRGKDLVASADVMLTHYYTPDGVFSSYIQFYFDRRIVFEEGAVYTLLFPEGSVRMKSRHEVVNREIRINIMGTAYVPPLLGEENTSEIVPLYCSFNKMDMFVGGYPDPPVFYDVEDPVFYFESWVNVKELARAYVMHGDEVVAVSKPLVAGDYHSSRGASVMLYMKFDTPLRLPKGKDYKIVVPAGSVYSVDNPSVVAGRLECAFHVSGDFTGEFSKYSSKIYDGCTLNSLLSGSVSFGQIETVPVGNPKICLYKGDELVAEGEVNIGWDFGMGYMNFNFGKEIPLEEGTHYQLVLPAGSACSIGREDIVNKEMRINIYGPQSGTGVSSATSSGLSVSCAGGVLHVSGASVGTPIEVFTIGGSMVRSCKAQSGSVQMPLPGKGCYVVHVGGKTKVVEC